ncbi:MAG: phosphoribosyltransferase family protein, partial [Tistlia sp.]
MVATAGIDEDQKRAQDLEAAHRVRTRAAVVALREWAGCRPHALGEPAMRVFANRTAAGQALAQRLLDKRYADPVVLALPRGGLPVAAEVARALGAPLDLVLVRKVGLPWQPELAVGAVVDGERPEFVVNEATRNLVEAHPETFAGIEARELREIE